jgi:hypothetical protein
MGAYLFYLLVPRYAVITYNEITGKITLVKGHFGHSMVNLFGRVSRKEEYETSQWVGINYLRCYGDDIIFKNNHFDAKHERNNI